jgi:hypothetical protein
MSIETLIQADIDHSWNTFLDPTSYAPFNRDAGGLLTVGCIDPRPTDEQFIPTIMQTSGGEGGLALDDTLVHTAIALQESIDPPSNMFSGFDRMASVRETYDYLRHDPEKDDYVPAPTGLYSPQVHSNTCRLLASVGRVYGEFATPNSFTIETLRSLWQRYNLSDSGVSESTLRQLSDAAKYKLEDAEQTDGEAMLQAAQQRSVEIVDTPGPNKAAFYIINHTPDRGLDRQRIYRDWPQPIKAQAYHATPFAVIENVIAPISEPKEHKALRVAALVARTAIVRGVLTDYGKAPLTFLDVSYDTGGKLTITEDRADSTVNWSLPEHSA